MINKAKQLAVFAAITIFVAAGFTTFQKSFALTNGGSITALGVALTENFNTLATSGTANPWSDNSTIPGWYSQFQTPVTNPTVYLAGSGTSNTGAIYSFGTGTTTERSLGSVSSGTPITIYTAAKLTNNTGATITSLAIAFTGEQWRNGGNTAAQTLAFQYQVANSGTITDANTPTTGWTAFTALDFVSPTTGATATELDGNAAANRTAKSATLSVTVNAGQEIWLRWVDINDAGNDHGLAVDDFSVTANGVGDSAPSVTSTTPADNANNVAVDSHIVITFSEPVNAPPAAFVLDCGPSTPGFSPSFTPPSTFTLVPTSNFSNNTTCTVTVQAAQVTDTDANDPPDNMAADYQFSFHTVAPEAAPAVTTTNPVNGATDVPVGSNIVINFSEPVTATVNAFAIQCGATTVAFGQTSGSNSTFTLDPNVNLPSNTPCTVTVNKDEISDTDANDPPDHMTADKVFSFTTQQVVATNIIINELDADTPGSPQDTAEFVELYDGGVGNTPLDGLVVVFYDGGGGSQPPNNTVYAQFDLDGFHTDANGYFVLGNPGVTGAQITFGPGPFGTLQNGPDAVALYVGNATAFPNGTAVTIANLLDAVVYHTDDTAASGLASLINSGQVQANEAGGNDSANQSLSRCENGTGGARNTDSYTTTVPTPGAANVCPQQGPPSTSVVISQFYGAGGNSGATYQNDYVELYNLGAQTVDLSGWSLQYAAATGRGWDFNVTPLGGPIAPGEYYFVQLAASSNPPNPPQGALLPIQPNVTGPINMSGTSGKIALVNSVAPLVGECPITNPHLVDLVGYGAANCGEGKTKAPALTTTKSDFRINGGLTDTNNNASDFVSATATPRRTSPIVELGPMVVTTDPAINGFDVPRDPTVVVQFSEATTVQLDQPYFDLTCSATGQHNSATAVNNGSFLDVTPNVNLLAGETCTFTLFKNYVHDTDIDDSAPNTDTLFADYSWSFTVASGTAPPYSADVHVTFGKPTNATTDVLHPDDYFMEKPEYNLSYNRDLGRPNWVSWHLSPEWYGTLTRVDTFRADPQVPPDWYRVEGFDFSGSGFDRGHMVPNADRDNQNSKPINQATYLMSNMVAQAPGNNQGPWAAFEAYLRTQADAGNELYIVAGPEGTGGVNESGQLKTTIANGHVTVPANTWKVALVLPAGSDDLSRVTCATRTIAVIMPNIDSIRPTAWETYLTSVDAVEALTGYDFFSNLSPQIQYCIESGINGVGNLPEDHDPPVIHCGSADGAWHGDNVDIACTAEESGNNSSGLVHSADASFSLTTSVADGAEDANASTGSRVVCDRAGNCATAAAIAGNMIDRKAPSITCGTADGAWHNSNVAIGCTASDAALVNAADASFSLVTAVAAGTADANASTSSRVVCDQAGNCSTAGPVSGNKVDLVGPAITLTRPADGAFYQVSHVVTASFSCADAGSGPATCTGTVANGAAIDTSMPGAKSFSVNATDVAGNGSSLTVTYNVVEKLPASIFINNIPGAAANGGSFTPTFTYTGGGTTHVDSLTQSVCKVTGGVVKFMSAGTCTLQARGTPNGTYDWAYGPLQSFVIAP